MNTDQLQVNKTLIVNGSPDGSNAISFTTEKINTSRNVAIQVIFTAQPC